MNDILRGARIERMRPVVDHSMKAPRKFRGGPLVMLGLVLGSWTAIRAMVWETPFPVVHDVLNSQPVAHSGRGAPPNAAKKLGETMPLGVQSQAGTVYDLSINQYGYGADVSRSPVMVPIGASDVSQTLLVPHEMRIQTAASHQLMWMAAMAYLPLPKSVKAAFERSEQRSIPFMDSESGRTIAPLHLNAQNESDRWSLDAWAYWRERSASSLVALDRASSYGASQAGAVLRYGLAPNSPRRPDAYVRIYSSLEGRLEQEVAGGFSARLVPKVPLRIHTEARALRSGGQTKTRMSGFVTTELPPIKLPLGATGEAYGQAGYVTGANKTAFADGQVHLLREVAEFDLAKVKVGGAVFGGAQKGAARIDVGPTMRVEIHIGETPARLSVDWRERVGGDAEPDSGLAVTLSTQF